MILFFSFRISLSLSFYASSLYSVGSVTSFNLKTQVLITMDPLCSYFTFLAQQMSMFSNPVIFDSVYTLESLPELFKKYQLSGLFQDQVQISKGGTQA